MKLATSVILLLGLTTMTIGGVESVQVMLRKRGSSDWQEEDADTVNLETSRSSEEIMAEAEKNVVTKSFCEEVLKGIKCKFAPYYDPSAGGYTEESRQDLIDQCNTKICNFEGKIEESKSDCFQIDIKCDDDEEEFDIDVETDADEAIETATGTATGGEEEGF